MVKVITHRLKLKACRREGLHGIIKEPPVIGLEFYQASVPEDMLIMLKEDRGGKPLVGIFILFRLSLKTKTCRLLFDKFKLIVPVFGPVLSKVAISRFTRTLGTLVSSGVPILQSLNIVKETSGNVVVANAVMSVHESVKEGETITAPLEASNIFPPMVISMVDVGEQTGDLPEMLMKIADTYDEEVDNASDTP